MENYSYLGLVAALATEADYLFIPELPMGLGWESNMCRKLKQVYNNLLYIFIFTRHKPNMYNGEKHIDNHLYKYLVVSTFVKFIMKELYFY